MPNFFVKFRIIARSLPSLAALACILGLQAQSQAQPEVNEANIRAAIVFRLLQASTWQALKASEILVCERGNGKHAEALQRLSQMALGAQSSIKFSSPSTDNINDCQVLIQGPEQEQALPSDLSQLYVICNNCDKNKDISTIDLFLRGDQIRYSINLSVASNLGIHFRSDALKYASRAEGK